MRTAGNKKGLGYEKENSKDKADFALFSSSGSIKLFMERMRRGETRLKDVRIQVNAH